MKARTVVVVVLALLAQTARAGKLDKLGDEVAYFYLNPSRENFLRLQTEADRLEDSLPKESNASLLIAVEIATAAEKHHWKISDGGQISRLAQEVRAGKSELAKYVRDDSIVDVVKLDIWWAGFCATGDDRYLAKILRRAKHPQPGERAADFMMPAMAAWSFKTNCRQHKAVLRFARSCLKSNAFPGKKEFLQECVKYGGTHPPRR